MLSIRNISYAIGKKLILDDLNIDFYPGEFNMILGPNGSGKSTFLKIFGGELRPTIGTVDYEGVNCFSLKKEELAKVRSVMSQQSELSFPLNVEEVVMMGRYPHFNFNPTKHDELVCKEAMYTMHIHDLIGRNYLTLSGGEKQRVQFARVLAQVWDVPSTSNRYLFLDEPLTNLDINYQQAFLEVAAQLKNAKTVLIAVMHDINLAVQFGDKLMFLKEGKIVGYGTPNEMVSEELIREVFKVDTEIITNPVTGGPLMVFK